MTVQVELFNNPKKIVCRHPKCDGRPAKWALPQAEDNSGGPMVSCSVHLARFVEVVMEIADRKKR